MRGSAISDRDQAECPLCLRALTWSACSRDARSRVNFTAGQHHQYCPAAWIDPCRLQVMSPAQVVAELP